MMKLRLKNYDWNSDKDRAKLWDAKNGELAQVQAKVDNQKTSNCCAGGKDCEVHVWWLPQKGPGLASTKDSCKKGAEKNSHEA